MNDLYVHGSESQCRSDHQAKEDLCHTADVIRFQRQSEQSQWVKDMTGRGSSNSGRIRLTWIFCLNIFVTINITSMDPCSTWNISLLSNGFPAILYKANSRESKALEEPSLIFLVALSA